MFQTLANYGLLLILLLFPSIKVSDDEERMSVGSRSSMRVSIRVASVTLTAPRSLKVCIYHAVVAVIELAFVGHGSICVLPMLSEYVIIKWSKMILELMVVLFVWAVGLGCSWCLWRGKILTVGKVASATKECCVNTFRFLLRQDEHIL